MAVSPDTANILDGPGNLYTAPLGTALPATRVSAWPAGWVKLGYTDQGSTYSRQAQTAEVRVEELLLPVRFATTGVVESIAFALAEITALNLQLAMNGGTITTSSGEVTFVPPDAGNETRVMIGWESDEVDGAGKPTVKAMFSRCFQKGSISMPLRRAPNKALIPVEFGVEVPAGSANPTKFFLAATRSGA